MNDAELSQASASARVLVDSLPGFTLDHLTTAAEAAVVQLARDEQTRRYLRQQRTVMKRYGRQHLMGVPRD
jgi:hypothetical protein